MSPWWMRPRPTPSRPARLNTQLAITTPASLGTPRPTRPPVTAYGLAIQHIGQHISTTQGGLTISGILLHFTPDTVLEVSMGGTPHVYIGGITLTITGTTPDSDTTLTVAPHTPVTITPLED